MKTKLIAVLTGVVALTACGGDDTTGAAPSPSGTGQGVVTASAPASPTGAGVPTAPADSPTPAGSSEGEGPSDSQGSAGQAGCPVTGAALLKALKRSAEYKGGDIAETASLTNVDCEKGYAVALTAPDAAEPLAVVFRHGANTWKLISFGSGGYCDAVPATVRPGLSMCV